jgi:hypothetical protein
MSQYFANSIYQKDDQCNGKNCPYISQNSANFDGAGDEDINEYRQDEDEDININKYQQNEDDSKNDLKVYKFSNNFSVGGATCTIIIIMIILLYIYFNYYSKST